MSAPLPGINESDLWPAGTFDKPHGIKGEITALTDDGITAALLVAVECIVVEVDGIFVPFFLRSVRPKTDSSLLLSLDGLDTDDAVGALKGSDFWIPRQRLEEYLEAHPEYATEFAAEDDPDAIYAEDLIGLEAYNGSEDCPLGKVSGYDDSTENVLLYITQSDNSEPIMVPFAPQLITNLDLEGGKIVFDLPEGLLTLHKQ